jgi:hypothetical protein
MLKADLARARPAAAAPSDVKDTAAPRGLIEAIDCKAFAALK